MALLRLWGIEPIGAAAPADVDRLLADGASIDAVIADLRLGADGSCLKAGKHRVSPAMTAEQLLAALCGPPIPDDRPFTVVEGWRVREIDAALASAGLIQAGAYLAVVTEPKGFTAAFPLPTDTLEGYLFPETYMVTPDRFDPRAFAQRQLQSAACQGVEFL